MEMQYFKDYSPALGRDMECKIYGHAGRPMLYIPCQDGRFFDFEDFHMADTLAPWIESGQIMVLSIDTLDKETWSDTNGNPYWRIRRYEQWLHYIVDECHRSIYNVWSQVLSYFDAFIIGLTATPDALDVVHSEQVGRIPTLIVRGNQDTVQELLAQCHPMLCDLLPLSLEEIFIYELGGVDYDVKNIVL